MDQGCSLPVVPGAGKPGPSPPGYCPRVPERGALRRLVHEHLETFLAEVRARSDDDGLPRFDTLSCEDRRAEARERSEGFTGATRRR